MKIQSRRFIAFSLRLNLDIRSISNPLRRDLSTNSLGAAQKVLENSIIWLAQ
jgi:hypothetical protein